MTVVQNNRSMQYHLRKKDLEMSLLVKSINLKCFVTTVYKSFELSREKIF